MSDADISGIASITFCQVTDLNFPQLIACLFGAGLCTGDNIIEIPAQKEVKKRSYEIAFRITRTICLIDDLKQPTWQACLIKYMNRRLFCSRFACVQTYPISFVARRQFALR